MSTVEIVDLTKICHCFPQKPSPEIIRDSFLDTLDELFESYPLVIVEGQDGIGKTTLVAQFCQRYPMQAIPVFVNPITRSSYDPDLIRLDLCNQVSWILTNKELEDIESIDIKSLWGIKRWDLQRKARNYKKKYYFVIDGLDEIPDDDAKYQELIFELLPLGEGNEFKFLLSGKSEKFPQNVLRKIQYKCFSMPGYTLDEAFQSLADMPIKREEVMEFYKISKIPGQYASINRLLKSGKTLNELIEDLPTSCPNLFEIEWQQVEISNKKLLEILALIAFSRVDLTIDEISQLLDQTESKIQEFLSPLRFIIFDTSGCNVRFVNDSFRKYVSSKLYQYKIEAENRVIDLLRTRPDNSRSIMYLPLLFDQAGKYGDLLNYLTPANFLRMLEIDQSLITVRETALLGVKTAQKLRRDGDIIGFGLQSAIIQELSSSDIWESEVEALIALKDSQAAIGLVERATTREDRFSLLSALANAKQKNQLDVQGVEEKIKNLYNQIDAKKLGERAIDIAANLINVLPDLAFDLVEKTANVEEGENALDWAFAKLSIKALEKNGDNFNSNDAIEKIQNKIKDPKVKGFSLKASMVITGLSATRIIAEVEKIDRASERLFLLRSWITNNRNNIDAADVVEYGLKIAISTTDYSPNARDYRELASPLPFIQNKEKLRKLISIFDGQKGTIDSLGPIEDYVRLLITLAAGEKDLDNNACLNRLVDIYLYISILDDLSTKNACLARFISALVTIDPEKKYENRDHLYTLATEEFDKNISELLKNTANQYVLTKRMLRALVRKLPTKALDIALKLNGEDRRDRAIYDLIDTYINLPDDQLDLAFVNDCFNNIKRFTIRDNALINVIKRIGGIEKYDRLNKNIVLNFIKNIHTIQDASKRCNACCLAMAFIAKSTEFKNIELDEKLFKLLYDSWEIIDVGWVKVNIGFKIVEALAEYPEQSRTFLLKVENYRDTILLDSDISGFTYLACARLCIRAFSGLFVDKLDTEDDYKRIIKVIENVPSVAERIELLTELALRYWIQNRKDEFDNIVRSKIKPLLQSLTIEDGDVRQFAIISAAPSLYLYHTVTAISIINELPIDIRDEAFKSICSFILTKRVNSEPYYDPSNSSAKKISFEEIKDVLSLLKEIDNDSAIFQLIGEITDGVEISRSNISRQQKAEIARELEDIIPNKFPNKKYVCQHDGYAVVTLAQIYKIKQANPSDWLKLIERARAIPNLADQVFILTHIAQVLPNRENERRKQILEEAASKIEQIPSFNDQINRYELIVSAALDIDAILAKKYIKLGMNISFNEDSSDAYTAQRKFIDYAYKLDPDLAASIASAADDDPARAKAKLNIQRRYSDLKLKDRIIDTDKESVVDKEKSEEDYTQASWILLGSLNAGKIVSMHFEKVREYALVASNLAISSSYPIFAWLIQNGIFRYQETPQAVDYLRPIFEATLTGCELTTSIARKSVIQIKKTKAFSNIPGSLNSSLVFDGVEHEEAKQQLIRWLKSNLSTFIKIADPYFGVKDLWILQVINSIDPNCEVYILTSKEHHSDFPQPWDSGYREFWRLQISDQDAPPTEIVIAGFKSTGKSPIHDRWWITKNSGLRIGTSVNSLGESRISEISNLSLSEVEEREEIINRFIVMKVREYKGERILYSSFTL